jgi:N-acetylneuraminic acid mutarotase
MHNRYFEFLEPRQLLSADLTNRIDANGQPITNTFPSTFYSSSFVAKINFQPSSVSTSKLPTGYKADNGKKYAARNGLSYGWSSDNQSNMRVRNSSKSADIRYDTLAQFTSSKKWEIAVPKGTYYVRYTVGDPNLAGTITTAEINVEGKFSLKEHLRANNLWLERGIYVNVTDGRLSITTPSSSTQRLDWIEVTGLKNKPPAPQPLTWTRRNGIDAPIGRIESEDVQIGDKLYIMGGFTEDYKNVTNRMYVFDLTNETWTRLADLPETQTHQGVCTDGRFIYVIGGQVGTPYNSAIGRRSTTHSYKYDTQTDTWSSFIEAPAVRLQPACQLIGSKIYLIGGAGDNQIDPVSDNFVLDLSDPDPHWVKKAPMPVAQDHPSSVQLDGRIYVVGGEHDHRVWHAEHDYLFVYDPATDKWKRLANVPIQASHFEGSTFVYQGQIFALGGAGDGQVPLWRVSAYNQATDKWTEYQHSPIGRLGATVGLLGSKLYYIGGDVLTSNKHTIQSVTVDTTNLPGTLPGAISAGTKTLFNSDAPVTDSLTAVI